MDEYALTDYFNFLGLFRKEDFINQKLKEKEKESLKIKMVSNIYSKLSLLLQFEKHYKIERFNLDFSNINDSIEISHDFQTVQKLVFSKIKLTNIKRTGLLKFYISILKNICGNISIIRRKQVKVNKINSYTHSIDIENIKSLIELSKL